MHVLLIVQARFVVQALLEVRGPTARARAAPSLLEAGLLEVVPLEIRLLEVALLEVVVLEGLRLEVALPEDCSRLRCSGSRRSRSS